MEEAKPFGSLLYSSSDLAAAVDAGPSYKECDLNSLWKQDCFLQEWELFSQVLFLSFPPPSPMI